MIPVPASITSITTAGSNISSSPTVSVNSVQNMITITQLNSSSSGIPVQTLYINVGLITNPGTSQPTTGFSFASYYQTGSSYLVATGNGNGITPTPGILNSQNIAITKSSNVVLSSGVTYTFSFQITDPIPINGNVTL
jgi:hypothetical protein